MIHDELVDLALMVKGIRTAEEGRTRLPYILDRLRGCLAPVGRLKPHRRRQPDADHALDWLHRSIADAPIDDEHRAEAVEIVGRLKALIGAPIASSPARSRSAAGRP